MSVVLDMPRDVTSTVLAESIKNQVTVVDLLQIKFPDEIGTLYWSNIPCTYDGHSYVARVLDVGAWSRSMNPESDTLSITLGNADGYITEIVNAVEIEQAQIKLIRYFPDINEAIDPLWVGYGGSIELNEERAEWEIYFGFRGFRNKGLRKFSENCWKIFSDRPKGYLQNLGYCPYWVNTLSYFRCGRAFNLLSNATIDDDHIHLEPNGQTDGALSEYLKIGDELVASDSGNEKMRVTSVSGDTAYVDRGIDGTEQTTHNYLTERFQFANCLKSKQDCERRGMYGPPTAPTGIGYQPYNLLRWFGGWSEHIPVMFGLYFSNAKKTGKRIFQQSTFGNETLMGDVIPAIWGTYRLRGIAAVAAADAKEFRHALFIIAEGECTGIAYNLVRMKSLPPDDCPNANSSGFSAVTMDSLIVWWGGQDNDNTAPRVAMNQGVGIMTGVGASVSLRTYLNNPYLFNLANGDGPSLADSFAVRVRVEEGGTDFDTSLPDLDIQFNGRRVRQVQSYVTEPNIDPTLTETRPDPIEVALDYLLNGKFGARLDVSMVDLVAAQTESTYCRATVTSVDPHFSYALAGTVDYGPLDTPTVAPNAINTWIVATFTAEIRDGELSGRTIKITESGKEQSKTILHNHKRYVIDPSVNNIDVVFGFHGKAMESATPVHMIQIDGTWDAGKIPTGGDTFEITGYSSADTVPRFKFNGGLTEDDSVESHLAAILQNCNGYYVSREGKIALKIKKAENLTYIDSLPVLTDYGTARNIIREGGVSSVKYKKVGISGMVNQIDLSYCDVDNSYLSTTMHVYDEASQQLYGQVLSGNRARVVNAKGITLVGTTSKDQAMRLGALALREAAMQRDTVSFEMSLKDSLTLEPGDVRKIDTNPTGSDTDRALAKNFPYIRIVKIEENSKFTAMVEGHRHENGSYDDTFSMCVGYPTDAGDENIANLPLNVTPEPADEIIEIAKDGTVLSVVEVEVTYPLA